MRHREITPSDIAVDLRRAVVAYFDVTGFMSWEKKSAVAHRDSTVFIRQMKCEFRRFCISSGLFCLSAGDGLIAIVETAPRGGSAPTLRLVRAAFRLIRVFERITARMEYPRPGGIRVRITAGAVYRIETPRLDDPSKYDVDFLGEPLNKASRLLEVERSCPVILDESAIAELAPADRRQLRLSAIPARGSTPRNVDPEDMRGLRRCAKGSRFARERRRAPRPK